MPQLIPIAIGIAAGIAAGALEVGVIVVGTYAISLAQVIGTVVAIGASYAMTAMGAFTSKPKAARPTNTGTAEDRKQIIRGSVEARQVIYGYARVGGAIVYAASSGDNLRYLHLVVVVATHQVAAIPALFLNSQAILDSDCDGAGNVTRGDHPMVGRVRVEKYLGTQTTGSSTLAAESPDGWSSTHALRGCAYLYIRLEYDQEKMPGLQTIEAEVRGKADIYDPRSTNSGFTANWALCVLDYLRSPFGLACADDEIDFSSFITAANLSDENVQIAADGTTQPRFLCDGSFKLDRAPIDIMEALLSAGSGALCYVAGQYRLYGGAYTTPTASLGISDFAGELEVTPRASRRDLFNGVRGTFIDPERGYQASEFGAVFDTGYDAQDGGERVWRDLEFAFTNDNIRAQRLARTVLMRARQSLRIKAPVKFSALRFCVWQMLYVTHPDLGLSAKPMRVVGWEYEPNTGVVIVELQAEAASAYAWVYDYAYNQPASPDTTLIDPLALPTPAPPSVAATTVLADDGAIVPAIAITWAAVNHAFVTAMEVQWRVNGGVWNTAFVPVGTRRFDVRPAVVGGSYEARIRATSQFGRSAWSSLSPAVSGAADATVPAAPTGISSVGGIRMIRVLWNAVTTRDMDRYRVYERLNSGSGWYIAAEPYSTDFVRAGLQPGEAREFQVSAVDRSGNEGPKSAVTGASASLLIAADIDDGILNTAKFASSIEPVSLATGVPTTKSTNTVFNTVDGKLYRWNGTAYTAAIPAVDVGNGLTNAQIADLDAAKLGGTLNVARIEDGSLTASKVVIQPNNLNQDPLFKDVAYWDNAFDPSGGSSTGWYRDGQNVATANGMAAQLSLWSGAGFTGTAVARFQTAAIAYGIRPASKYTLRFRAQNSTANQTLYVAVDWFDATAGYLSSTTKTVPPGTGIQAFITAQISPPEAAYGYRLSAQNSGGVAFNFSMSVGAIEFLMLADADLIVDGSIVASKIGVGAVEAGKLAAGSVVTSNLAVGSSNLIWNSTFSNGDTTGWGGWAQTGDGTVRANLHADWTLRGFGTGYMHPATGVLAAGAVFTGNWTPSGGNLPVVPGQKYQAFALVQAHRCTARVDIIWFNASNGFLSESNSATVSNYIPGVGTEEANYARLTVLGTAPTGAVYAVMRVIGWGTGAADPYLFWTKAMFGQAPANATEVGLWEPGGVTQISGGQLVTRSISADRIATNAITANELAANSVVAGKIAVSAISSNQIAAGEIKAVNLAADTLITSAAQMGTAVITSANIADLNVTRLKTANGAITGAVSQSQYNNVTIGPPLPWEGWGGFGYNIAVLSVVDITIDWRDNGLVVVFPDSNTEQIEQIIYVDYGNTGGGADGGNGGVE